MSPLFKLLDGKDNFSIIKFSLLLILVAGLSACDLKNFLAEDVEDGNAIRTSSYNYTPYDFINITYQDIKEDSDILRAIDGGSAYAYEENRSDLGSGTFVHSEEMLCCFGWKKGQVKDVTLRVKWLAVYDRGRYRQASSKSDERLTREPLAGSRWCQALVKVSKPYPEDPDVFSIHFLPDGTLQAYVSKYKEMGPLSADIVLAHTTSTSPIICKTPTSNPFYMIPRLPHRE